MNSLIRWNEKRLEHLELVDENYDWMEYMSQAEELEGDQFLDPFIYAAWRCPNLCTIKIGNINSFSYFTIFLILTTTDLLTSLISTLCAWVMIL